nr:MAG: hypothetical protein [Chemarfal virus 155]
MTYDGPFECPTGLEWRQGWWAGSGRAAHNPLEAWARTLGKPGYVSATPELATLWQDNVLYVEPVFGRKLWRCGERECTDGRRRTHYFLAGDILHREGQEFKAERLGREDGRTIKLIPTEQSFARWAVSGLAAHASFLRYVNSEEILVVQTNQAPEVAPEERAMVEWTLTVQSERDPLTLAALSRLRQNAASKKFEDTTRAQDARDFVKQLRAGFPQVESVAGAFAWGYCYSCGKQLPGKFSKRLCGPCGARRNQPLGGLVAEGYKVCSDACPVAYPGVVNTPTRHPPLKPGVETAATEAVFRLAPSVSRQPCAVPPLNA